MLPLVSLHVRAERPIAAPAPSVYALLSDYEEGHARILPPAHFARLRVTRRHARSTLIAFEMRMLGKWRPVQMLVTEPEPGRVLQESALEGGFVTTFTLDPLEGGRRTRVRIDTRWTAPWWRAGFDRLLLAGYLRRVYAEELRALSHEMTRPAAWAA